MIDITPRVEGAAAQAKITTAEAAAALIQDGMNIGISGFTPSGHPKVVPHALAERAKVDPLKVNIWAGASVGPEVDTELTEAGAINRRVPYQTNDTIRKAINNGTVKYTDMHLSTVAQAARYGFMAGCRDVDIAIVEAVRIIDLGDNEIGMVPSTSAGNTASFMQSAPQVIIEVNISQPLALEGIHDMLVLPDPPHRGPIPLTHPADRIGETFVRVNLDKVAAIVPSDGMDKTRPLGELDDASIQMGKHLVAFLKKEVAAGRLPENLLPLQSGVGSVANAVMSGLVNSDFENLTVYTEVIQDGMLDLIDAGKLEVCSGTALSPSPDGLVRFYDNVEHYTKNIVLRPTEISNNPEISRRIGVIAMNTAIEVDLYGNVNSTHITGTKIMNGIGGSGDFARPAYLTCFFTTSEAKGGKISSVVPFCSHIDHTEHDVDVIISEQGVADLRGLSPKERAQAMIDHVASPKYRPLLQDYFDRATEACGGSHTPHIMQEAFSFHTRFLETGSMEA